MPYSVRKKSMFIEDLIRYVLDGNPLKVYITTGKTIRVTGSAQDNDLSNS